MAFIMCSSAHNSNKIRDFIPVSDTLIGPATSFSASDKESAWRWKNAALEHDQLHHKCFVSFDKCYYVPSALKPHHLLCVEFVRLRWRQKAGSAAQPEFATLLKLDFPWYMIQNTPIIYRMDCCFIPQVSRMPFPCSENVLANICFLLSFDTSPGLWKSSCLFHVFSLSSSAASFDPGEGGCGTLDASYRTKNTQNQI